MAAMDTRAQIIETLTAQFDPVVLEVLDESYRHRGHAQAGGGGHFHVRIVSAAFEGQSMVGRQRLIYGALTKLMQTEIHALSMETLTSAEAQAR